MFRRLKDYYFDTHIRFDGRKVLFPRINRIMLTVIPAMLVLLFVLTAILSSMPGGSEYMKAFLDRFFIVLTI